MENEMDPALGWVFGFRVTLVEAGFMKGGYVGIR